MVEGGRLSVGCVVGLLDSPLSKQLLEAELEGVNVHSSVGLKKAEEVVVRRLDGLRELVSVKSACEKREDRIESMLSNRLKKLEILLGRG